ncbi:hypothetical protein [Actinoplanes sp. NPDC051494]|uniref:hypothetical protein n=1 Tax=Actinoplanes sp. NPDC051494 TaxID=3363907 RepID=UPI0037AB3721
MHSLLHAAETSSAPSEADWLAVVVAAIAVIVAAVAGFYAKRSADAADKNVTAAERSASAAEVSAAIAKDSVSIAKDSAYASSVSANAAADLLRVELDRLHNEYEPKKNGEWLFVPHNRHPDHRWLQFRFKLDREYLVLATASATNDTVTTVCSVTPPGQPDDWWLVWVEDWSSDRDHSAWRELTLRFWPPQARVGRARPWNCVCGRQLDPGEGDTAAHWDFEVDVKPPESYDLMASLG